MSDSVNRLKSKYEEDEEERKRREAEASSSNLMNRLREKYDTEEEVLPKASDNRERAKAFSEKYNNPSKKSQDEFEKRHPKTKNKNLIEKASFVGKNFNAGLHSGLAGIPQGILTDMANQTQKGSKKEYGEIIGDAFKGVKNIINPLGAVSDFATSFPSVIGKNINNFTDKSKNNWEKATSYGLDALDYANSQLPTSKLVNGGMQLLGKANPNITKDLLNMNEALEKPLETKRNEIANEAQDYDRITQLLGNAGQSIGNMVPSIAVSAITKNPNLGLGVMGLSVKGQATNEALKKGAELEQAVKIGNTKAMIEVGTEMLTGGINVFGKGALDEIITKGIDKKVKNDVLNFLAKKGMDIPGEILEETISDLLGTTIDKGAVDPNASYSIKDWSDTAIETTLTTVILNALTGGYSRNAYNQNVAELTKNNTDLINQVQNENSQKNNAQNQVLNDFSEQGQQTISLESKWSENGTTSELNALTETELPTGMYKYQKSENNKIDAVRKDMSKYFVNSNEAKQFGSVVEKLIQDKNYNIRFDDSITDKRGNAVNGKITTLKNGEVEIIINPKSKNAGEFLLMHEVTHAIGTREMENYVMKYAKSHPDFAESLQELQETYNSQNVNSEVLADVSGQLFGTQEFINSLIAENTTESRTFIQKVYEGLQKIKNMFSAEGRYKNFVSKLENMWREAYFTQHNNLNNTEYSLIGVNSKTGQKMSKTIEDLISKGKTTDDIFKETGWTLTQQGWEYDLDDSKWKIRDLTNTSLSNLTLKNLLDADNLYNEYNDIGNISIKFDKLKNEASAQYNPMDKNKVETITIDLNKNLDEEEFKSSLYHEIQHAIQRREGFESGSNIKFFELNGGLFLNNDIESKKIELYENVAKQLKIDLDDISNADVNATDEYMEIYDSINEYELNLLKINENENLIKYYDTQWIYAKTESQAQKYSDKIKEVRTIQSKLKEDNEILKNDFKKYNLNLEKLENAVDLQSKYNHYQNNDYDKFRNLVFEMYQNTLGEQQAREVQKRYKQSYDIRKKTPISYETEESLRTNSFYKSLENQQKRNYNISKEVINNAKIQENVRRGSNESLPRMGNNIAEMGERRENNKTRNVERSFRYSESTKPDAINVENSNKSSFSMDNKGRTLSKEQQKYFKDSKVRDENGKLLEVYHGTENKFNIYKSDYNEFYFTDNQSATKDYGSVLKKQYLKMENPYIIDMKNGNDKVIFDAIDYAKENGYDGVIAKNTYDGANYHNQYVVFNSNQIKNVDNTNPTSNPDIRYSKKTNKWQEYLNKHYKTVGTTTDMRQLAPTAKNNTVARADYNKPLVDLVNKSKASEEEKASMLEYINSKKINATEYQNMTNMIKEINEQYSMQENEKLDTTKTYSNGRKETYRKYMNDKSEYSTKEFENILEFSRPNSQGRRTKEQWIGIAKQLGTDIAEKSNSEIEKIAYKTWQDTKPNSKEMLNRQGEKFVKFDSDEWINTIYNSVKEQREKYSMSSDMGETNTKKEKAKIEYAETSTAVDSHSRKQRKHYKSIMESQYTTEQAKKISKELLKADEYVPESNKKQLEVADERISNSSAESELDSLMSKSIHGGEIKSVDIAIGERLIQYYSKTGDATKLRDAIQATAMAGTSAGQAVQAFSLLNHQTPEGQAIWLTRSVEKMNSDLRKKRGAKAEQFTLTEEMTQRIINSKDTAELNQNMDAIYKELGQQVSKTTIEKLDAWRYFSMLANPRTHIRNIVGNTAMHATQYGIKNKVAGAIEGVVNTFNPDMKRTHTVVPASKEVKNFAKSDIVNVEDRLGLNDNKYNPKSRLENNMRTFKSDAMEKTIGKAFKINDSLLEAEDGIGLKAGYVKSLSEYMTANKLTPQNITDKQLAEARNFAIEEAKQATFHQESALSTLLNQLGRTNKFGKFALDALLPYKKTPINIAKTGFEYSPLGIVKSATYDIVKLRKGEITVNKYIDNISKGLTGTGIAMVGMALAKAGLLKASGDDDKDKETFEEEQGKQQYSIEIAGNTYSLDWLAPVAIPLFVGAEAQAQLDKKKEQSSLGQYGKGNIDLYNRPVVENEDGSISTVRSMSFEENGKEVLIPTVVNGKVVSNEEAIKYYHKTGQYLGKFNSVKEANEYAEKLHNEQSKLYSEDNKTIDDVVNKFASMLNGLGTTLNPMNEMSMISGLTSALKSYNSENTAGSLMDIGASAIKSYLGQYVPTALGQLAKTIDGKERSTKTTKTGTVERTVDSLKNQVMAKIPGLREKLPVKNDIWGNELTMSDNIAERAINNFLEPYTKKEINNSKVNTSLSELYDNIGEKSVLPKAINKDLTINSKKYRLSSEEYSKYSKKYGKFSYDMLESFIGSENYKELSDEDKEFAIDKIYKYANEQVKAEYAKDKKITYDKTELNNNTKVQVSGKTMQVGNDEYYRKTDMKTGETDWTKLKKGEMKEANISTKTYTDYQEKVEQETIKQRNNGTIKEDGSIKDKDKMNILLSSSYSSKEKTEIYENYIKSSNDKKYPVVKAMGIDIDKYMKFLVSKSNGEFESDRKDDGTEKGEAISGSGKKKLWNYIDSTKGLTYTQKCVLYGLNTKPDSTQREIIYNYITNMEGKKSAEKKEMLKAFSWITWNKDGTKVTY